MSVIELRSIGIDGASLQGLDLTVERGEVIGLGSTPGNDGDRLARILALEQEPWTGEYYLMGTPVHELDSTYRRELRHAHLGVVLSDDRLVPELTIFENLEVPLTRRTRLRDREALIAPVMADLDLEDFRDCFPRALSRRETQLVKIARALVGSPAAIIADDLSSCLRSPDWARVAELLRSAAARGTALLVVNRSELRALARPFGTVREDEPAPAFLAAS